MISSRGIFILRKFSAGLDQRLPGSTAQLYNDLLYFSDADNPYSATYRYQTDCAGTTCRTVHPVTGRVTTNDIRRSRFSGRGIQWTVLGQKGGVTLVKRKSRSTSSSGTDYDWTGYGGWTTHNAFFSRWQEGVDGRYEALRSGLELLGGFGVKQQPALHQRPLGRLHGRDRRRSQLHPRQSGIARQSE